MKKLSQIVSGLALAGLIFTSSVSAQKSMDPKTFTPEFNYVEAGIDDTGESRLRSYTTNSLSDEQIEFRHAGFHEVYNLDGFFTRNGFFLGKKDGRVSGGVIQSFTEEEVLPTKLGVRLNKLPFSLYGFLDAEIEAADLGHGAVVNPGFTMFAGKDVKGFGGKPLSLWYFTFGDVTDMGKMYNEIQANQNIAKGLSVGTRVELYEFDPKTVIVNFNLNYTF